MFASCLAKQAAIKQLFVKCKNEEECYQKIIELGRRAPPMKAENKRPDHLVKGCQSTMYLHTFLEKGKVYFEAESDALISSGLGQILTLVYSGEDPETILKCPPSYLEELGISASLTPNRANGLYSVHLRMKQEALKYYIQQEQQKPPL